MFINIIRFQPKLALLEVMLVLGKKILLDIETNEPHDCPARNNQQQQQGQQPEEMQR